MSGPFPARLHVLLARDAATGVVIRRGPTRKVCVIGWNRSNDSFEVGQWLYGRIYERRCDLSPDGKHFLYFAMNGRWDSEVLGSWTAVSRAPYLKATGLWPKGDCWNGGGLFIDNREFWLNDGYGHKQFLDGSGLKQRRDYPWKDSYGGECPGVYYLRLQRDGWELTGRESNGKRSRITTFRKRINDRWTLLKRAHETIDHPVGRGCYFDEHALKSKDQDTPLPLHEWEWADVDAGRLVWAAEGKLFSGRLDAKGLTSSKMLHDFNDLAYERLTAPY
ncbi:hypothetical protein DFR24_1540 [Panacagrimonas perspica]|uniref:Uncharacterized protein n=1 Tax=Panacagrimonas perspica TaxID=381431 RepID=A0A4S3JZX1_9GAMM|nr:hypothetical protein [Panacagrimonas perspica]TDU32151.1 hypothetical protein DFR24_1540 [Panacagrimonas perspica]THD01146.1 hypothetical protein B1810_21390 [Panacagrimonas perspica]